MIDCNTGFVLWLIGWFFTVGVLLALQNDWGRRKDLFTTVGLLALSPVIWPAILGWMLT